MKPCCIILMVFLIGFTVGGKYEDEIKKCKDSVGKVKTCGDRKCEGPYCIGFTDKSTDNSCQMNPPTNCGVDTPVVASFSRDDETLKVLLMGKLAGGKGYIAIGFSETEFIMEDGNFAVVCFSGDKQVKVFDLPKKRKDAPELNLKPTISANQSSINGTSVTIENDFIICEFLLNVHPQTKNVNPKTNKDSLDFLQVQYYIGFAIGGDEMVPADNILQKYHGKARTSSKQAMRVLDIDIKDGGSTGGGSRSSEGSNDKTSTTKTDGGSDPPKDTSDNSHGSRITITIVGIVGTILSTFGAIYLV